MSQKEVNKSAFAQQIHINEYDYTLPNERIANFPLEKRDQSKLLLYQNGKISENIFYKLPDLIPQNSLIVFNNTRVIRARLLFTKSTGAQIEIFCLEPENPRDYVLNFQERKQCRWNCLIGNLKRWKEGCLQRSFTIGQDKVTISVERESTDGNTHCVLFKWDNPAFTFANILEATGILPIPPYLNRKTEPSDLQTYQTVYSKIKGSVAAPTAGLHFTPEVLQELEGKGLKKEEVTLHVGAGTFKPVQTATINDHDMHTELISVNRSTVENLLNHTGPIISVGTTSVRTIESLYYIGQTISRNPDVTPESLAVKQWDPYAKNSLQISPKETLQHILDYMKNNGIEELVTSTQIIIVPGYKFHFVSGIITNFHQPKSTLLLLVSAFVGGDWKKIYDYALKHDFRFLSYGDSSFLSV